MKLNLSINICSSLSRLSAYLTVREGSIVSRIISFCVICPFASRTLKTSFADGGSFSSLICFISVPDVLSTKTIPHFVSPCAYNVLIELSPIFNRTVHDCELITMKVVLVIKSLGFLSI